MIHYLLGLIVVCLVIFAILLYEVLIHPYLQYRYYQQQSRQDPNLLIDMPPAFVPLFGDLIRLSKAIKLHDDPFVLIREAIRSRARFSVGFIGCIPRIAIMDVDVIQELLSAKMFDWTGISRITSLLFGLMVPNSLIALEGLHWQQRRKLVMPVFRYSMMKIYADSISNIVQERLNDIQDCDKEIDFVQLFKRWALYIIGTCAFGGAFSDSDESDRKLSDSAMKSLSAMFERAGEFAVNPLNIIPGWSWFPSPARVRFRSSIQRAQAIANEVIKRRLEGHQSTVGCERDLLDVLLTYKCPETGKSLSLDEIRDECLLFIVAGHETTSNLLSWLFVAFSQHPDIQAQCREEILHVLQSNGSSFPTETDIKSMHFLHSCLLETLRFYPPVPLLARQTRRPYDLGGLKVQSGTLLRIDIWAIHHSPRYWKDPETFNPNRFLHEDDNGKIRIGPPADVHSHAFLPFGHGIRNCPGQGFALLEARIITAGILSNFDVEFSPGQKFPMKVAVTSCPKYGVMGHLRPRPDSQFSNTEI